MKKHYVILAIILSNSENTPGCKQIKKKTFFHLISKSFYVNFASFF